MILPKTGLYAITQTVNKMPNQVISEVSAALKAGISLLQYRDKQPVNAIYLAGALKELCHSHNIPLIINDDINLAKLIGADGVHIGQEDGQLSYAREILGKNALIGVSCYDSLDRALEAEQNSADYVAFGRFFPSHSKPLAAPAHISTLQKAKNSIKVPIIAIGGILPTNGAELLTAGADILAVIGGIFDQTPYQSALAYQALFK
ncbi:thiamine phosphate synthase [methanotrophic endosymbiont of Bathymodiolus puteoserpentis (Logatchev)]|jgi:thiamine-phosphate pyrophosphorylase|uniref:thiamine phosphate synthase n=1 Tax=methanotrophic endosymbiont of Bathymodiolus puteoserpentis (Logatchev) TaxID=343235 RepID=UPI0013C9ED14|nr:thiamine phosphate synthase [methanotrophic endosymbiont of Bathymodiolus puteoserpentis (Logatchev)]SHE21579.1 Thiamin-phosphate pyrophosphorylase [methanotrophic endosymbiont of Bathymodiolus puteoserpentis (Logatchev)]